MSQKLYVGTVYLYQNNKIYGATTRQYWAKDPANLRKIFQEKFKFKNNVVKVAGIRRLK
jgi:hypothetical protein